MSYLYLRSVDKDLETQITILTTNQTLQVCFYLNIFIFFLYVPGSFL